MKALLQAPAKTETVTAMDLSIGEQMDAKAKAFAATQGGLGDTIAMIAKAKQDYEGGPFAVLFKVSSLMTAEQVDALPNPDADAGNNPGIYKVAPDSGKGKPIEHKYYYIVSDNLACNVAKQTRINQLELSLGDPTTVNMSAIPQDIQDMDKEYRSAEILRLKGELKTSRKNVLEAFELLFQIRAANELAGVNVSVLYAIGKDGKLQDGEDGRPQVVENTTSPIYVVTTVEGRQAKDNCYLPVSTFKRLNVAKAKENGGTYKAFIESAPKRGTKGEAAAATGGNKPDLIATSDKFQARVTDLHSYMDGVWSNTDKADYQSLLKTVGPRGPAGSDDFALSLYSIYTMLGDLYRHDQVRARAEALKEADATGERKAA